MTSADQNTAADETTSRTTRVNGVEEVAALAGTDLGTGPWTQVDQQRINLFADATDDHQWIHVDVERAASGPFGGPIAHGYLTLSLVIPMWSELLQIDGITTAVNYGLNKVRFPAPVPAGSRVRLAARVAETRLLGTEPSAGVEVTADLTVECDAAAKPVCVAQAVYRYYP